MCNILSAIFLQKESRTVVKHLAVDLHAGLHPDCILLCRKMADSMLHKVVFTLFCWLMIVYATILGLIGLTWITICHPMTAFKSKKRNGERQITTVALRCG